MVGREQGGGHWWREGGPSHLPSSSTSSKPGSVHWQGLRLPSPSVDGPTADASGPPAPGCRPSSACRVVASTLQAARWIGQRAAHSADIAWTCLEVAAARGLVAGNSTVFEVRVEFIPLRIEAGALHAYRFYDNSGASCQHRPSLEQVGEPARTRPAAQLSPPPHKTAVHTHTHSKGT